MRTTSGRVRRTASTASAPSAASAVDLDAVRGQDHPEAGPYQGLVVGDDRSEGSAAVAMVAAVAGYGSWGPPGDSGR